MTDDTFRGYTIFCDDIRTEIGGKSTFVGVYDTILYVHGDFPFSLPKFGMAVRYIEKRGAYSNEELTLRIFMPGDDENHPSVQGSLPLQEARGTIPPVFPDTDPNEPRYLQVATNIVIAPLVIPKPGIINVYAQCGTETIKLGRLRILKAPTKEAKS